MLQIALTILVVLIPFLLVLFLRTNAAILFFVLCGAATLQTYLDKDVSSFTGAIFPGGNNHLLSMFIFIFPFVVAAVAFRHTVSKSHLPFHLLLGLLVGSCLVFVGPQFLTPDMMSTIRSSQPYQSMEAYSSLIIAASLLLSTVFLWVSHPRHHADKKRHHGH